MWRSLKEAIVVLFHPSVWFPVYEYSYAWDLQFRHLLMTEEFKPMFSVDGEINRFEAMLGDYKLWVENLPYGCFHENGALILYRQRPSRYGCLLGAKKVREMFAKTELALEINKKRSLGQGQWVKIPPELTSQITEIKVNTEILLKKLVNKPKRRK